MQWIHCEEMKLPISHDKTGRTSGLLWIINNVVIAPNKVEIATPDNINVAKFKPIELRAIK